MKDLEELKSLTIRWEHSKPTEKQSLGPAVAGCMAIQGTKCSQCDSYVVENSTYDLSNISVEVNFIIYCVFFILSVNI